VYEKAVLLSQALLVIRKESQLHAAGLLFVMIAISVKHPADLLRL